jgi:putrescine aminotransferase
MMDPVTARYAKHINPAFIRLLGTFGYGRVFEGASGSEIWDAEGRRYLDFLSGFGCTNLGHNPKGLLARIQEALGSDLAHVVQVGPQAYAAQLGEAFAERVPELPMALLSLSGGEAVESALKLARAATGRGAIVSCVRGFHGTGFGNLSVMSDVRWRKPFAPLLPECHYVAFEDLNALESSLKKHRPAAFLLEMIQAEGGVRMASDTYFLEAQKLCRTFGTLLVIDEVQTGLGRTGKLFAYQHVQGLDPDVVVVGKALGAGVLPVSATLTRRALQQKAYGTAKTFDLHGSTYAGYALGCIAALEVLRALDAEGLFEASTQKGRYLVSALCKRIGNHPMVRDVRGQGLMVAIELGATGTGLLQKLAPSLVGLVSREVFGQWLAFKLLEVGILCQPSSQAWDVLKLTPPLTISERELDIFVEAVATILDEYRDVASVLQDVAVRMAAQYSNDWSFG